MSGYDWRHPPAREAGVTRIVSFNIRNGRSIDLRHSWWQRRTAVLRTLQRLDPDVVGLQEAFAFQADWLCRRLPGFGCYGVGRANGARRGEQMLVLHRQDVYQRRRADTRWYGSDPDHPGSRLPGAEFPRTAAILVLEHRQRGGTFGFVNTHLDARNAANRRRSAAQLATWVGDLGLPTAVVGDLNDDADGPAASQLQHDLHLVHAIAADAGGTSHGFTGRTDGRRIDHILVPPSWRVVGGGVDHRRVEGRLASDHWPVVADVVLSDGVP